jgi:hypothetical protein
MELANLVAERADIDLRQPVACLTALAAIAVSKVSIVWSSGVRSKISEMPRVAAPATPRASASFISLSWQRPSFISRVCRGKARIEAEIGHFHPNKVSAKT